MPSLPDGPKVVAFLRDPVSTKASHAELIAKNHLFSPARDSTNVQVNFKD
jgi:hypothetical protein